MCNSVPCPAEETIKTVLILNHHAVHLKLIQKNIEKKTLYQFMYRVGSTQIF